MASKLMAGMSWIFLGLAAVSLILCVPFLVVLGIHSFLRSRTETNRYRRKPSLQSKRFGTDTHGN
jgi:hypothetical protein